MSDVQLLFSSAEGELEISLREGPLYISLNDEAVISISEQRLDQSCASIHRRDGKLFIEHNADPACPLRLNDHPITQGETELHTFDRITAGDSILRLKIEETSELAQAPAPEAETGAQPASPSRRRAALLALLLIACVALPVGYYLKRKGRRALPDLHLPEALSIRPADPYQSAINRIQKDRGEPVGNQAKTSVPAELKLYSDRKRFLAIQVAEAREQNYKVPLDFPQLAEMERRGELVRVPMLGEGYALYGVGVRADDELTHYDKETGKSVPLFSSEEELKGEEENLDASLKQLDEQEAELRSQLAKLKKGERSEVKELQEQLAEVKKAREPLRERRELLSDFYRSAEHRRMMVEEYRLLSDLARDFEGKPYDLSDADSRKAFKVALLSHLRPAALAQLQALGQEFEQKFDSPLPVTSLVRTREYQRELNEAGNPNAIQIDVPPHTTGLAFDVFTHYMTAAEQQFLMDTIARLKREGKLEALRENRDHIHVFAFPDGRPPDESLIKQASGATGKKG